MVNKLLIRPYLRGGVGGPAMIMVGGKSLNMDVYGLFTSSWSFLQNTGRKIVTAIICNHYKFFLGKQNG